MIAEAVIKWGIYRVLMGLLPIALGFAFIILDSNTAQSFVILFSGGQLFLIGTAISIGAIGELISTPKKHPHMRIICSGICLLGGIVAACIYGWNISRISRGEDIDGVRVMIISAFLYITNVIAALTCILIAESAKITAGAVKPSTSKGAT